MKTDVLIDQEIKLKNITEVSDALQIDHTMIDLYGKHKAKLSLELLNKEQKGKLILMTSISPTPAGEGKTTMNIGLSMALNKIGKKAISALREPSLGPCFGMKGGATGGGFSQVHPMVDINLHFTGDFHAITSAHNLLAAMIDNHIFHGNDLGIDPDQVIWNRVMDMNDRALRQITVGLGGATNGFLREDGFDIVSASEIMAIICLSRNLMDLRSRLGKIVIGLNLDGVPVTAEDIGAAGAMAAARCAARRRCVSAALCGRHRVRTHTWDTALTAGVS